MKRILSYIAVIAGAWMLSSCNLDLFPKSNISTDAALNSVSDCEKFRTGLYNGMKYAFTGGFVYAPELQTDLYHAVRNFGNFEGEFYHYSTTGSSSTVRVAWYGIYSYITNANFLIEGARRFMDDGSLSSADRALAAQYYAEACYIRAHMYFKLSQLFCNDYDPATAASEMGVPVVTKWVPSVKKRDFPARNTLEETYKQILSDIAEAKKYITAQGEPLSKYVTKDVITAFEARLALAMDDYGTARVKAEELIDAGRYPLVSDAGKYASGWVNDDLSETIWRVYMADATEKGNGFSYFIYNNSGRVGQDNPQYVPEDWVLDLYDKDNDIRYNAYFEQRSINTPVVGALTMLIKYSGNPRLQTSASGASNYAHMPQVFRISEMYLIAAEACAMTDKDAEASAHLNNLRRKRIAGWTDQNYTGLKLMSEIRNERVKELFGEGDRLNDLKRWHIGFTRSLGQNPSLIMQGEGYAGATRTADDPMFVWPIPTSEMEANPQMKQNSGYQNS